MTRSAVRLPAPVGRRRFLGLSAGAAGLGLAAAGVGLGACGGAGGSATPSAADIGFLTDMSAHHGQALVMCQRVLGQDIGAPVKAAASEVLQNQAIEIGMMRAWLMDWGASTAPPETVMAWMHDGDEMPLAMMPGLATDAELTELSQLDGTAMGRRWLELMRAHHIGGVAMADAAVLLAESDKVIRLARTQSTVQSYEIEQYDLLLATTYAP